MDNHATTPAPLVATLLLRLARRELQWSDRDADDWKVDFERDPAWAQAALLEVIEHERNRTRAHCQPEADQAPASAQASAEAPAATVRTAHTFQGTSGGGPSGVVRRPLFR